jgi:translation elongation factor EF-Ts
MTTANINSKDVMALRERTGLGMMDCKAALIEANGDAKHHVHHVVLIVQEITAAVAAT